MIEQNRGIEQLLSLPIGDLVDIYSQLPRITMENVPNYGGVSQEVKEGRQRLKTWLEEYKPVIRSGIAVGADVISELTDEVNKIKTRTEWDESWLEIVLTYESGQIWDEEGSFWQDRQRSIKAEEINLPSADDREAELRWARFEEARMRSMEAIKKALQFYMIAEIMAGPGSKEIQEAVINRLMICGFIEEAQKLVDTLRDD